MEKKVVELFGLVFKMLLRKWSNGNNMLEQNLIDVEEFALQCGKSIWEAKKFNRTIESYIDAMAEDFIKEYGVVIQEDERKLAVLYQIQKDIEKVCLDEYKIVEKMADSEKLRNAIMEQSMDERKLWSGKENGVYVNCVQYIAKTGLEFITKLPEFTPQALNIIMLRQNEYFKELNSILNEIHTMTSLIKSVDRAYQEYEAIYRERLIEKYNKVELIGSGIKDRNIRRYDISSAYVELNCVNTADKYGKEIKSSQVFANHNVVWIKGEAGSGKTTFLQWVAVCTAKNDDQKIKNINRAVPLVIELRNTEWPLNLQKVANKITSSMGDKCPDGWISDLLTNQRIVLLFDGFDEISVERRDDTYRFIEEEILKKYSKTKVLLTARNSIKDTIACKNISYEIVPMKIQNIKKFITYWHRSVLHQDAIISDKEISRLKHNLIMKIVENPSLKALAKNPLLCAMICALNYINDEHLPNEKMELYEKCCEMLMDSRDSYRHITTDLYKDVPELDFSSKRKILEEIAYWMMVGGVSSENKQTVIAFIEHLSIDTNIFNNTNKKINPKLVLNFLIERSGIIREPEDGIIDFVHKTFMEFLAVKTICRNCAWNELIKEACNPNWKETIIMCFHEMGPESVKLVLNVMLEKGKNLMDDRYILIASLCASNAVFLSDNELRLKIDNNIKTMIPPKSEQIIELSQAGNYILPFLKDSEAYTDAERMQCLELMDYIGTDEVIPILLSYLRGNGSNYIKTCALFILSEYNNMALEEFNVRDELLIELENSVKDELLITYESVLNILSNVKLGQQKADFFGNVKKIQVNCGTSNDSLYAGEMNFLRYLQNCSRVELTGNVYQINFLNSFPNIEELLIETKDDLSGAVQELAELKTLNNVKKLIINAGSLNYFCENDIRHMRNLETLEIYCRDEDLELNFNDLNQFTSLKKLVLGVDYDVYETIEEEIQHLKTNNKKLEVLYSVKKDMIFEITEEGLLDSTLYL